MRHTNTLNMRHTNTLNMRYNSAPIGAWSLPAQRDLTLFVGAMTVVYGQTVGGRRLMGDVEEPIK